MPSNIVNRIDNKENRGTNRLEFDQDLQETFISLSCSYNCEAFASEYFKNLSKH